MPQDLSAHRCITYRQGKIGALYAWEFEKDRRALNVRVEGVLAVSDVFPALEAAVEDLGLPYVPEDAASPHMRAGPLQQVLADGCLPSTGYHLHYPSRRQMVPALARLVNALRWR